MLQLCEQEQYPIYRMQVEVHFVLEPFTPSTSTAGGKGAPANSLGRGAALRMRKHIHNLVSDFSWLSRLVTL